MAISMDMGEPSIKATTAAVPGAKDQIVLNRFHFMQHALRALDRVRRAENKCICCGNSPDVHSQVLIQMWNIGGPLANGNSRDLHTHDYRNDVFFL